MGNVWEKVTVGFGFSSDWMKKWHKFFKLIMYRSNAKPIFDTNETHSSNS